MTWIKTALKTGRCDWIIFLLAVVACVAGAEWIPFYDPELPLLFVLLCAPALGLSALIRKFETGFVFWGLQLVRVWFMGAGLLCFGLLTMAKGFQTDPRTIRSWSRIDSLRSAISIYTGDMEGVPPSTLDALVPKYADQIPVIKIPALNRAFLFVKYHHPPTAKVEYYDSTAKTPPSLDRDTGGWAYVRSGPRAGELYIDCTHKNTRGTTWVEFSAP